ncbi:recombination protein NinG [Neomegalonema sp.]|uniref:recombination protein NinG n=1 Tax=Neomegalonema sp. TaxID=2039713 RepID=UPI002611B89D|nr:recombination protein NinG [Neomegalonema sp.]MDD2869623.1 recombination protein NinG [Neomegalonema sp.]
MKKKNKGLKYYKSKAWEAFSEFIRLRDSFKTTGTLTHAQCCTCGKVYPSFGKGCLQAGHFISGRHASILLDERNTHAQCYACNNILKGNWPKYYDFMKTIYGQSTIDWLLALDKVVIYPDAMYYQEKLEEYKRKAAELRKNNN